MATGPALSSDQTTGSGSAMLAPHIGQRVRLGSGVIETANAVTRAYTRAVVERVGSALQAAPKLGLSRQTVASYLTSTGMP